MVERLLHAREQQQDIRGNEVLRARQGPVEQTFQRQGVTARKAIDQRYSESNGLPIDEDTKLKKRRTFGRDARYIYYQ